MFRCTYLWAILYLQSIVWHMVTYLWVMQSPFQQVVSVTHGWAAGRRDGFMPFTRVLVQSEMLSAKSRIWT